MPQDSLPGQPFPPEWLTKALPQLGTLTDRQHEILLCLGLGMDNSAIARELACSERTVKQHITGIFGRLGITSRLQAGLIGYQRWVHRYGVLAVPAEEER